MFKSFVTGAAVIAAGMMISSMDALALGECGLSCCIGTAVNSPVTLASRFGISMQYEHSFMKTIRAGTSAISPDEVIGRNWRTGDSYSVPLKMTMRKINMVAGVPLNERLSLIAAAPYIINDMTMRMKGAMGMVMDHHMPTVSGMGDVSLMTLYTLYTDAPVRPGERLTIGAGLKLPTGKNDFRTDSGALIHAMMQPGTGSWDPLLSVTYLRAYYPLILQGSVFTQFSTTGDEGYRFGSQFNYELSSIYQVYAWVNTGVSLNGVIAGKDSDTRNRFSRAGSMVDTVGNTGVHSVFLTPVVQIKIPSTGGSMDLRYQHPVYQRMNGNQQAVDSRVLATLTWNL